MSIPALIRMERDPSRFPPPHQAEVPQSEVPGFAAADWTVAEDQPEHVRKLIDLAEAGHRPGGAIAILCPGPSLSVTWPRNRKQYQATIGVNRAAHFAPVDWWAGMDANLWTIWGWANPRVGVCGSVRIFTGSANNLLPRDGLLASVCEPPAGCPHFSALMAIHFAFEHLKASSVDMFGCDMTGVNDFTGKHDGSNRSDQRWSEERAGMDMLRKKYGKRLSFVRA
jgi:hypothetical protein